MTEPGVPPSQAGEKKIGTFPITGTLNCRNSLVVEESFHEDRKVSIASANERFLEGKRGVVIESVHPAVRGTQGGNRLLRGKVHRVSREDEGPTATNRVIESTLNWAGEIKIIYCMRQSL